MDTIGLIYNTMIWLFRMIRLSCDYFEFGVHNLLEQNKTVLFCWTICSEPNLSNFTDFNFLFFNDFGLFEVKKKSNSFIKKNDKNRKFRFLFIGNHRTKVFRGDLLITRTAFTTVYMCTQCLYSVHCTVYYSTVTVLVETVLF